MEQWNWSSSFKNMMDFTSRCFYWILSLSVAFTIPAGNWRVHWSLSIRSCLAIFMVLESSDKLFLQRNLGLLPIGFSSHTNFTTRSSFCFLMCTAHISLSALTTLTMYGFPFSAVSDPELFWVLVFHLPIYTPKGFSFCCN